MITEKQADMMLERKKVNGRNAVKIPYQLFNNPKLKDKIIMRSRGQKYTVTEAEKLCVDEEHDYKDIDWGKGLWFFEIRTLKDRYTYDGFEDDYFNAYLLDTPLERIARGNEPIPGGRFASKKKRAQIMQDDFFNAYEYNFGKALIRYYPKGDNKQFLEDCKKLFELDDKFDWTKHKPANEYDYKYNQYGDKCYIEEAAMCQEYPYMEADKNRDYINNYVDKMKRKIKENDYQIEVKVYPYKWTRGHLYRTRFWKYNDCKDKHYCAYCGKKIMISCKKDSELFYGSLEKGEVDHIIPVSKLMNNSKMEDGTSYRELAKTLGITRADSPLNLVASCHRCNSMKKSYTKGYLKRTFFLGRHRWFGILRHYVPIIFVALIVLSIWYVIQFR